MNLIARAKAGINAFRGKAAPNSLSSVDDNRGWTLMGNWGQDPSWFQRDIQVNHGAVLAQSSTFACVTLISSDIGKLRIALVSKIDGVWQETTNSAYSPVLRKPNGYQTRQQFIEAWTISKLTRGNTYVLLERDQRQVVIKMHVLDPSRVRPLVAPDGSVYYELCDDNLAGVTEDMVAVPASEIAHDRFNCLFHPLVGLSPIFASGLAAMQGLHIQQNSAKFFRNMSQPGGVLTAPLKINEDTAKRIKDYWEKEFSGERVGRVAVLGDGLTYQAMGVNPVDAQMAEQLKLSAQQVCSTFHVPAYMIGAEVAPPYTNIQALGIQYYSQCLQSLIEAIEATLDESLGIGNAYATELDISQLLRMDTASRYEANAKAIGAGWLSPNEVRQREDLPPVDGGESPMAQMQNFSLAALAKRDARPDPFATGTASASAEPPGPSKALNADETTALEARAGHEMRKALASIRRGSR